MSDMVDQGLKAAAKVLAEARDVTLFGHLNPDADAFGSAIGLGWLCGTAALSFGCRSVPRTRFRNHCASGQ